MQHNELNGALEAFGRYTRAFQALDARAVARHFHEPAFIRRQIVERSAVHAALTTSCEFRS
jgi:hypothetical protein